MAVTARVTEQIVALVTPHQRVRIEAEADRSRLSKAEVIREALVKSGYPEGTDEQNEEAQAKLEAERKARAKRARERR